MAFFKIASQLNNLRQLAPREKSCNGMLDSRVLTSCRNPLRFNGIFVSDKRTFWKIYSEKRKYSNVDSRRRNISSDRLISPFLEIKVKFKKFNFSDSTWYQNDDVKYISLYFISGKRCIRMLCEQTKRKNVFNEWRKSFSLWNLYVCVCTYIKLNVKQHFYQVPK